ncbi:MAG: hypothetical protein ACRDK7_15855 [Solirubrobacteraceae bacterium]
MLDGVPEDVVDQDEDRHGRWLMAQLLDYHRREAKPVWWAYFERLEADEQQLVEVDTEALGGLADAGVAPTPAPGYPQSLIHTLRFPVQEHKVGPGNFVDPTNGKNVTVESVENEAGLVRIRRGSKSVGEPLPRALIPGGPYRTPLQRAALRRLADDIVEHGPYTCEHALSIENGRYGALRQILLREVPTTSARPRGAALQTGAFDLEDAQEIAEGLDDSYLFIQGPPDLVSHCTSTVTG